MPHGGGNVPFQAARYRALAHHEQVGAVRHFVKRFYFDTTVYSQEAMELLIRVVGVDNVVFASEMLGGVNATDPATGRSFDDNRRFIDAIAWLIGRRSAEDFRSERRQAYPRLRRSRLSVSTRSRHRVDLEIRLAEKTLAALKVGPSRQPSCASSICRTFHPTRRC